MNQCEFTDAYMHHSAAMSWLVHLNKQLAQKCTNSPWIVRYCNSKPTFCIFILHYRINWLIFHEVSELNWACESMSFWHRVQIPKKSLGYTKSYLSDSKYGPLHTISLMVHFHNYLNRRKKIRLHSTICFPTHLKGRLWSRGGGY